MCAKSCKNLLISDWNIPKNKRWTFLLGHSVHGCNRPYRRPPLTQVSTEFIAPRFPPVCPTDCDVRRLEVRVLLWLAHAAGTTISSWCGAWIAGFCYRCRTLRGPFVVCMLVMTVSSVRPAEPIKMPSDAGLLVWTPKLLLDGVQIGATSRIRWNDSWVAAFRLWSLVACRTRKSLECRSSVDDERITLLESQLKEAKYSAEDADRKYEEVRLC